MIKRKISILLGVMTVSFLLGVGFAESYTSSSYSFNYNYPSYSSTCDYCGQDSSATHYNHYDTVVTCPDCGDTRTVSDSIPNSGSSTCAVIDRGVTRYERCSTCEIINNIMEILIPPPEREPYDPPPIPPDTPRREPVGYAFVPHDSSVSLVTASEVTLPELLLRLSTLFTPRENQRGDVWLDGWDLWYYGNPTPRKELPEDLKFRIENEVGVNV